jgi:MFS family permease
MVRVGRYPVFRDTWLRPGSARTFAITQFFNSIGVGLYTSAVAVYFTRVVGLPPWQVGIGLSVSGLAWILLAVPVGRLVDRIGPRKAAVGASLLQAIPLTVAVHARSFEEYVTVVMAIGLLEQTAIIGGNALLIGVIVKAEQVRVLAALRSVFNLGLTLGLFLAGVAFAVGTPTGYRLLFLGNALTAVIVAVLTTRQPRVVGTRERVAGRWGAAGDLPYVSLAVLCGLITVHDVILSVGVPLWIVTQTRAPAGLAAWILGLNTLMVVALQVPASRPAATVDGARRLQRRACLAVAVSCLFFGAARGPSGGTAVALLVVGVVVLSVGELWSSAANWKLRFEFAKPGAQGQYAGVFSMGVSLRAVVGPAAVAVLTGQLLLAGWIALALLFGLAFFVVNPVVAGVGRRLGDA